MRPTSGTKTFASLVAIAAGLLAVACSSSSHEPGSSDGDGGHAGEAPDGVTVTISPAMANTVPGGRVTFTATVDGASSQEVTWDVEEGASGGTIDAAGHYEAPAAGGVYHVVAASQARPGAKAKAPVVVAAPGACDGLLGVDAWEEITPQEFRTPANMQTIAVVVNPQQPNVVFAAAGNVTNGPACPEGETCPIVGSGVFRSDDCGSHWQKVSTGENGTAFEVGDLWHLRIDPLQPDVLVTMNGYGGPPTLFRSTNGGKDWKDLFADDPAIKAFQYGGFVRSFDLDPTDANHIVVAFHEPCLGAIAGGAAGGVMCLAETTNAGESWRLVVGPVPVTGADGGAPTIVAGKAWLYTDPTGGFYTGDAGKTWKTVVPWEQSSGFWPLNHGAAYFAPDGRLFFGTGLGVVVSKASPGSPLGTSFTEVSGAQKAKVVIGDGERLFTSWGSNAFDEAFYTAPMDGLSPFTPMSAPTMEGGGGTLAYDPIHHIVYSANWSAGLWRVVTQ